MKNKVVVVLLLIFIPLSVWARNDGILKNKFFSITIPKDFSGTYEVKIKKDRISVFDKTSKDAGFGGFAFGIKAYKNPSDHATLPGGRKIGELSDKKGILYDIVLKYPTDVQYDYTKNSKIPDSYKKLYDLGSVINIEGTGKSKYYKDQGTKGEELYKEVLKDFISKISSDSAKLEKNDMSYMYNVLSKNGNLLDKVGYTYYDINADGIDELIIGEIAQGDWKGVIYDIYTMVNRRPKHVISGGSRNRFFVCDDVFLCNEYSASAFESGLRVYTLVENSTELFPQVSFKYDSYANKTKPWFISYGNELNNDKWENVDEKTFKERKTIFERYQRFDYKPFNFRSTK